MHLPSDFTTEPVLPQTGFRRGLRVQPAGPPVNYLERWLADEGPAAVADLVHEHGFLVLANNTMTKTRKGLFRTVHVAPVWSEYLELPSDTRSLFWHRDYDGVLDENNIAGTAQAYLGDRFSDGLLTLHYPGPARYGRSHGATGVVDKRALAPVLHALAADRGMESSEAAVRDAVKILSRVIASNGGDAQRYGDLSADLTVLLAGYDDFLRDDKALAWTTEKLGNAVYWHRWPNTSETLVVSNREMAHARYVSESKRMDVLDRMLLYVPRNAQE